MLVATTSRTSEDVFCYSFMQFYFCNLVTKLNIRFSGCYPQSAVNIVVISNRFPLNCIINHMKIHSLVYIPGWKRPV